MVSMASSFAKPAALASEAAMRVPRLPVNDVVPVSPFEAFRLVCATYGVKEMAERIVASGDKVEDYIDIKLSVSESRYTNWPTALQEQFAAARTVEEGKPSITLTLDGGVA